jgi:hypothetical protein
VGKLFPSLLSPGGTFGKPKSSMMTRHLLSSLLLFSFSAKAQAPFKLSNGISSVLPKVIHDFPNRFTNIKGDVLEEDPLITKYECLLNIKDEPPGVITRFGHEKDHEYSWSNVLLQTENYAEAKKRFRIYYAEITQTSAIVDGKRIRLAADFVEPDESKKFCSVLFDVGSSEGETGRMVVDLTMQYEMSEWKITVSLYQMDDETKIHAPE